MDPNRYMICLILVTNAYKSPAISVGDTCRLYRPQYAAGIYFIDRETMNGNVDPDNISTHSVKSKEKPQGCFSDNIDFKFW